MTLARWNGHIQTTAGAAVGSAYVEVRRLDGLTLEPLYSDREGETPKANPFQADSSGYAFFHADGGAFRVRAYATGFERVWDYVPVGLAAESDLTTESLGEDVAAVLAGAEGKATPVNADGVPLIDSEDDDALKLLTFANLWAWIKAKADTFYQAIDAQLSSLIRQNSRSAAYTLALTDSGKHIFHPSADTTARIWTIPANSSVAFPIGTAVTFVNQNDAGVITIAITTDTMRLAGAGTTGSRTLAANGVATAIKVTSTEWIISGTGLT